MYVRLQLCAAGRLMGKAELIAEVWRPDPDIVALTASPQPLVRALRSERQGKGEPTQSPDWQTVRKPSFR